MSIIELGALGEFIGSIAVVITLIYLAAQIRANTRTTKANASFQATHSWAEVTQGLSELPGDQLDALTGSFRLGGAAGSCFPDPVAGPPAQLVGTAPPNVFYHDGLKLSGLLQAGLTSLEALAEGVRLAHSLGISVV